MKQIIKYKSREEWLQNRSKGIGASEAGTVLGLNPWETPYQLWRRKKGIDPPKVENFAMVAGHLLEDAVAQFFKRESHCHIIKASSPQRKSHHGSFLPDSIPQSWHPLQYHACIWA